MINETLVPIVVNETLNQTSPSAISFTFGYAQNVLFPRIVDMVLAPAEHPEMIWTLGPMMVALVLMQLYFGRNRDEALGWNTAFGNSIALIFISVSLLRGLYILSDYPSVESFITAAFNFQELKFIIIVLLFAYGIFLSLLSFFHWIPERIAFFIMNGISINVTAYVVIVLVNSDNIPLDWHTVFAGMIIFIAVYAFSLLVRLFVPASLHSRIGLLKRKKYILDADVVLYEKKAREAKSDARKAKFNRRATEFKMRAAATNKIIEGLEAEAGL